MAPKRTGTILARSTAKRPKDPSKAAKREQKRLEEREDEKAWWDRVERVVGKLVSPEALKVYAGGVAGGVAFYPQMFEVVDDKSLVSGFPTTERKREGIPGHQDADVLRECLRGCEALPPGAREACRVHCHNAYNGRWVETDVPGGWEAFWDLRYRILVNAHVFVPDVQIDIPQLLGGGELFDLLKALSFYIR